MVILLIELKCYLTKHSDKQHKMYFFNYCNIMQIIIPSDSGQAIAATTVTT